MDLPELTKLQPHLPYGPFQRILDAAKPDLPPREVEGSL